MGKYPDENLIYKFIFYKEIGQIPNVYSLSIIYYSLAIISLITVSLYLAYQNKIQLYKNEGEDINNICLHIKQFKKEKKYLNERYTL